LQLESNNMTCIGPGVWIGNWTEQLYYVEYQRL
jgi:hypothetical protein